MRTWIRNGLYSAVLCGPALIAPPSVAAQESPAASDGTVSEGMIAYASNAGFAETLARVEPAVTTRGLFLMHVLDHSAAAARFGRDLPPNSVVLFGNPQIGSQLMTCSPRAGIDLPQKLLIWQDSGAVSVGYNDPQYLTRRHSIEGCDEILEKVAGNLDAIAREVAGS